MTHLGELAAHMEQHDRQQRLADFIRESNRIERITGFTTREADEYDRFLKLARIDVADLERFVSVVAPGAVLRRRKGMDVFVQGSAHRPPAGGKTIRPMLYLLMGRANSTRFSPKDAYEVHQDYEALHPFIDGNGRSGRALWLWQMGGIGVLRYPFLHEWYYQSLEYGSNRTSGIHVSQRGGR
ncbi:MAG: Fic family protein [Chloroflexi bacterium]|nr:Fic family protein [Chloroflexota bacterium]